MKKLTLFLTGLFYLIGTSSVLAQTWSQCPDGESIARCETYDCPQGDTNGDGTCNLSDQNAKLTSSRNDSLCANPPSNCGVVLYYKKNTALACAVRVKENTNNCDLYQASSPVFATATPSATATPRPTSTPTSRPAATQTPSPSPTSVTKGGLTATDSAQTSLPETGPSALSFVFLVSMGFVGFYLFNRFDPKKIASDHA